MGQKRRCLLHNNTTGNPPFFGVSPLSPSSPAHSSSSLHPCLQLMGLTDQELRQQMAKDHSYAFNMGNNNIIPFQNFQGAAKELMKRNMPEVLNNIQKEAVFMPNVHLPKMPSVVDQQEYMMRFLRINPTKADGDLGMARGDQAESELFMELKKFYRNKKVVVFWGLKLRLPGKDRGAHQEFDFVIVDRELKAVIADILKV